MYSLDGRLSLQSLSEFDSSRSWLGEKIIASPPPPPLPPPAFEDDNDSAIYMGISLPRRLTTIFSNVNSSSTVRGIDDSYRNQIESTEIEDEMSSENDVVSEHCRICLVCYRGKIVKNETNDSSLRKWVNNTFGNRYVEYSNDA